MRSADSPAGPLARSLRTLLAVAAAPWLLGPASAAEPTPAMHTVYLRSSAEAVDEPFALTFDRRLTVVCPGTIRLAVPGSPDVIGVTVKDKIAVVTLVDSDFVRHERPGTNLTLILTDGTVVTLLLSVAARPQEMTTELVTLVPGPELAQADRSAALAWLKRWAAGEDVPPELERALAPAGEHLQSRIESALLTRLAANGAEIVPRPGRAQTHFIYLTGDRVVLLGDAAYLRLTVTNRSQPTFNIGRVHVGSGEGEDAGRPAFSAPDPAVLPDGNPRALAVRLPPEQARAPLHVEVCEATPGDRCVAVDLPAP